MAVSFSSRDLHMANTGKSSSYWDGTWLSHCEFHCSFRNCQWSRSVHCLIYRMDAIEPMSQSMSGAKKESARRLKYLLTSKKFQLEQQTPVSAENSKISPFVCLGFPRTVASRNCVPPCQLCSKTGGGPALLTTLTRLLLFFSTRMCSSFPTSLCTKTSPSRLYF